MDELEGGLRVVVEAAHHARIDDVRDADRIEVREHLVEVRASGVREMVEHQRCVGGHLADLGALVVEHAQRVDLGAAARLLVEREREQELLQLLPVLRTAGLVAEGRDLEAESVESERPESCVGDRDDLGVERGIVDADRLHADLLELTVATRLGALVAEERPGIGQLHGELTAVEAVLDHCAHHARGARDAA